MPENSPIMEKLNEAHAAHSAELMNKPNVVGVAIGYKQINGKTTNKLCLVVMVTQKLPKSQLAPEDVIPSQVDGVCVDVQEMGMFRAQ